MNWKKSVGILYAVLLLPAIIFLGFILYAIALSGEVFWGISEDRATTSILFACIPITLIIGGIFGGLFPNKAKSWSTVLVSLPLVFIVWVVFAIFV